MIEEWRDIRGFDGVYQISNLGRVKSIDHYASNGKTQILYKGKIRKNKILPNGYEVVMINHKNYYIHRLVAIAFIDNPNGYKEVNHIDENKLNNCVNNLEWCCRGYNATYKDLHKRIGLRQRGITRNNKPIIQLNLKGEIVGKYLSALQANAQTGIDFSSIRKVTKGKLKTAGGYIWKEIA